LSVFPKSFSPKPNRAVGAVSAICLALSGVLSAGSGLYANAQSASSRSELAATTAPRGLEALGSPTIVGSGYTNSYHNASQTALVIGFTKYVQGFQMTSTACWSPVTCNSRINYTWKVPSSYKVLKADVGYDLTDVCTGTTIGLLGNDGRALRLALSSGKFVAVMPVPASGAAPISVDVAGNSILTIQLHIGFRAATGYAYKGSCGGEYNSVIDVVNDQLS